MQQKMADYRQPAPEVSWDALDKALVANKTKGRAVLMWTRRIAAAVAILLISTVGYLVLDHGDGSHDPISKINGVTENRPRDLAENRPRDLAKSVANLQDNKPLQPTSQGDNLRVRLAQRTTLPARSDVATAPASVDTVAITTDHADNTSESRQTENTTESRQVSATTTPRHTVSYPTLPQHQKKSASGSRLMANVYLSNGIVGTSSPMSASVNRYLFDTGYGELKTQLENDGQFTQNGWKKEKKYTHHQPVRFGITLSYRLNNRWSIESGLVYSRLSSDYLTTEEDVARGTIKYTSKIEQRLNYLGIPLKVNFYLWENRHFAAYLSAGGMVEKMVDGCVKDATSKVGESVSIGPLQFSVNGAVGAEYKLIDLLSIYAEPGVGYYFDNGSTIPTFYQDKPFSFNLNLGLRFNLK